MRELTDRQAEVLDFIRGFTWNNNFPPTVREIANYFKMSAAGAQCHKLALERKGFIDSQRQKARTITIKEN